MHIGGTRFTRSTRQLLHGEVDGHNLASLIDSGLIGSMEEGSGRASARAENAQGTPTHSHMSPSKLECTMKKKRKNASRVRNLDLA